MNYRTSINKGALILKKNLIPTATLDAEILFSISINKSREQILLNLENKINMSQFHLYLDLINRRKNNEPVSLIIGKKFFWNNYFQVNKHVLTPRFETELIVEEILKKYRYRNNINILDVGVGSGCILISLLSERKNWRGTGLDISKLAIKVAKTNAKIQQICNRIRFINSDVDKYYANKYDLIVSNPPYINKIEYNNLNLGVKDYEPLQALYGGIDGLNIIVKIIKRSKDILKKNGLIVMEIGQGQHQKVCEILRNDGFYVLKTVRDYQRIKRFIFASKTN